MNRVDAFLAESDAGEAGPSAPPDSPAHSRPSPRSRDDSDPVAPEVLEDIEYDGGVESGGWVDMLPVWNPRSRKSGVYVDGITAVVVGHKGAGKSRTMAWLCYLYRKYVDRAMAVSTTDAKTGIFGRAGLIHPAFIQDEPSLDDVKALVVERREEMKMWAEHGHDGPDGYRQRSLLVLLDDAAYSGEVLGRRTSEMLDLMTNARHYSLHMYIALQTMGLLNKQSRSNVDLTFMLREHNGEALTEMYDKVIKHSTPLSAVVFREIMDEVCIRGKRGLVFDGRYGTLYQYNLDFDRITLPRPLGNTWWLRQGDKMLRGKTRDERPEAMMKAAARRRWEEPKKKKK